MAPKKAATCARLTLRNRVIDRKENFVSSRRTPKVKTEKKESTREIVLRSRSVNVCLPIIEVETYKPVVQQRILKKHVKLESGAIVFAKVKGYQHWPAIVTESRDNNYKVEFFGTHDFRVVAPGSLLPFNDTNIKQHGTSRNQKYHGIFTKAMDEAMNN